MSRNVLKELIQKAETRELMQLIEIKKRCAAFQEERAEVAEELEKVTEELNLIYEKLPDLGIEFLPPKRRGKTKAGEPLLSDDPKTARRQRTSHPRLSELVFEVMKESDKPVTVKEIAEVLRSEKEYKSESKNLEANIRVMLYTNRQGLFTKVDRGLFTVAEAPSPKEEAPKPTKPTYILRRKDEMQPAPEE